MIMKTLNLKNNQIQITKISKGYKVKINNEDECITLEVNGNFITDWNGNGENELEDLGLSSQEIIYIVSDYDAEEARKFAQYLIKTSK